MIQRIQTIYLLLVTALLITSMCLPVGSFIGADAAMYTFKPLGVEQNGMFYSTWGVFGILLKKDLNAAFQISWALCLPLISIILNYLAIRAIGRDEVMVKAADRLR